jgi:hypothetical protein
MSLLQIPVTSEFPNTELSVDLELITYILKFNFNSRTSLWYMTISQEDGTPLVVGVPIFTDVDIMIQYKNPDLPPGIFMAFDTEDLSADAGRDDLGNRVKLLYQES